MSEVKISAQQSNSSGPNAVTTGSQMSKQSVLPVDISFANLAQVCFWLVGWLVD